MIKKAIINNIECFVEKSQHLIITRLDSMVIYVLSSSFEEFVEIQKKLENSIGGEIIGATFYKNTFFKNGMNSSYQFIIKKGSFNLDLYLITE